jgi:uncharacterized protein YecT (DUF1311 family)
MLCRMFSKRLLIVSVVAALLLVGCGKDDKKAATTTSAPTTSTSVASTTTTAATGPKAVVYDKSCEKTAKTTDEIQACADSELKELEAQLSKENDLHHVSELDQHDFIEARNDVCTSEAGDEYSGGSMEGSAFTFCEVTKTVERIEQLRNQK